MNFDSKGPALRRVLCLGAHCDDIEIGCGGTILRLIQEHPELEFCWIVFGAADPERRREGGASAELFLQGVEKKRVVFHQFRDGFFPYLGGEIKEMFLSLEKEFSPDLVFTHCRQDLHQDHRVISELTWNSFRNHLILEYEIPKYEGDLGAPNAFWPLAAEVCSRKVEYLMSAFQTQHGKYWFTEATFRSLLRIRGLEARADTGYAEGFYSRKLQF